MKSQDVKKQNLSSDVSPKLGSNSEVKTTQMNNKIQDSEKIKKELLSQPSLNNKSWNKRKVTRVIPLELKRKVWKRDGGCCQYQDPLTGKNVEPFIN